MLLHRIDQENSTVPSFCEHDVNLFMIGLFQPITNCHIAVIQMLSKITFSICNMINKILYACLIQVMNVYIIYNYNPVKGTECDR